MLFYFVVEYGVKSTDVLVVLSTVQNQFCLLIKSNLLLFVSEVFFFLFLLLDYLF